MGSWQACCITGPVFCLWLRVSLDCAQPITGQVTEVTWPVIGLAQPELTLSKIQKMGPGLRRNYSTNFLHSVDSHHCHYDVIKWKHFPHYWPFVRGIHQSLVDSSSQRPVTRSFDVFFDLCLNKWLGNRKQSRSRWFETPSQSLRCHCNVQTVVTYCISCFYLTGNDTHQIW